MLLRGCGLPRVDVCAAWHRGEVQGTSSYATLPASVKVVEVGPRDGLQNETHHLATNVKVALVDRLTGCGLRNIEVTSFVNPKRVPQFSDACAVMAKIHRNPAVSYSALTPNMKGLHRALKARVPEVAVFASATEAFSQHNLHCTVAESLERYRHVVEVARGAGVRVRGYVSMIAHCPYSGAVDPTAPAIIARQLIDLGCYEVSLGDTTGTATPAAVERVLNACVAQGISLQALAGHFHDTYGQALANVYAALTAGVATFDASVAGLGGCPFAPGATGNLATEDLVYLLSGLHLKHGVDLDKLADTGRYVCHVLGRRTTSKAADALLAHVTPEHAHADADASCTVVRKPGEEAQKRATGSPVQRVLAGLT